jgi:hypothetical protein
MNKDLIWMRAGVVAGIIMMAVFYVVAHFLHKML